MSDACYCDYGDAECQLYRKNEHKARKAHRCYECGGPIRPGERYEHVFAIWDGDPSNCKTCCRCLDLRQYITAHAPCFCWLHGSMLDDAQSVIEQYAHESAGFFIGATQRYVRATGSFPWSTERHPLRDPKRRAGATHD